MRPLAAVGYYCGCLGAAICLAPLGGGAQQPPAPALPPAAQRPEEFRAPAVEENPAPVSDAEQSAVFQKISGEVERIFDKCKGAVVQIDAMDIYGPHAGSGFFIDPSGTIYTSSSVAGRSWNIVVKYGDKEFPAKCLLDDPRSGIAILKIEATARTPFLPLGRAITLRVAAPVIVIGYPMDLPAAPSLGLVAGFDQKFLGNYLPTTHIRANVPVQSGEQGAPMLNEKGEVVGILMCRFDYGAACLGLPIQAAEKVRADYLRFGRVSPGWIGVTAAPVDGNESTDPVKVTGLADDAPAAHCGLQEGDVILKVGHTPVHRFADLRDASFFLTAEEKVPITVQRGEKELTVEVRAGNPPGFHVGPDASESPMDSGPKLALPAVARGADRQP